MIYYVYYLLRPTSELMNELNGFGDASRVILSTPRLWINQEGDGAWSPDDFTARIKLLFLANLAQEYIGEYPSDPLGILITRLLGEPPWATHIFDQWWGIERFTDFESAEQVQQYLNVRSVKLLSEPDRPLLKKWLLELILSKESD